MKGIFSILAGAFVLCLPSGPLMAQEKKKTSAPKSGFLRIVHAVAPGEGGMFVKVDGEDVHPEGYSLGDVTGGVVTKPGVREVTISREGVKEGKTQVKVEVNETTILIPFAERVPASDVEPAHWAIRVLRLKQLDPESERSATFVSVSGKPEIKVEIRDPGGKWSPIYVKRLSVAQAPIKYPRGYVPLRAEGMKLSSIPVADIGNYVVLLYDDAEGVTKARNFRDHKFLSAD